MDSLKAGNLFLRYAIQKGVTIVQPGQDEGTNSIVARVNINKPSYSVEVPDMKVKRPEELRDMIVHLHMRVKNCT